uniref:Uncharacterized protein n=1 Tax=Anguilla anguilla TaxID=7936 RepID=A0A0E9SBL6_ANGAN
MTSSFPHIHYHSEIKYKTNTTALDIFAAECQLP